MIPEFAIKCEESIGLYEPLGLREDLIHFFNKNIKKIYIYIYFFLYFRYIDIISKYRKY